MKQCCFFVQPQFRQPCICFPSQAILDADGSYLRCCNVYHRCCLSYKTHISRKTYNPPGYSRIYRNYDSDGNTGSICSFRSIRNSGFHSCHRFSILSFAYWPSQTRQEDTGASLIRFRFTLIFYWGHLGFCTSSTRIRQTATANCDVHIYCQILVAF